MEHQTLFNLINSRIQNVFYFLNYYLRILLIEVCGLGRLKCCLGF